MEVEGAVLIGAAIIAVTQAVKHVWPNVNGAFTIAVSVALGILVALIDKEIGVTDMTVAQGIMVALAASGTVTVAKNI